MLTVKFFSLIREAVGTEELTLARPAGVTTLLHLKEHLAEQGGEAWQTALSHPNLVQAVNQRVVNPDHTLGDDDEVAFFPPMTGG